MPDFCLIRAVYVSFLIIPSVPFSKKPIRGSNISPAKGYPCRSNVRRVPMRHDPPNLIFVLIAKPRPNTFSTRFPDEINYSSQCISLKLLFFSLITYLQCRLAETSIIKPVLFIFCYLHVTTPARCYGRAYIEEPQYIRRC